MVQILPTCNHFIQDTVVTFKLLLQPIKVSEEKKKDISKLIWLLDADVWKQMQGYLIK